MDGIEVLVGIGTLFTGGLVNSVARSSAGMDGIEVLVGIGTLFTGGQGDLSTV